MTSTALAPQPRSTGATGPGAPRGGFRLMRYFTLTTLVAFAAVAAALYVLQRGEETFFEEVQREQARFFTQAQAELALQHEAAARASLMAVHETAHVNLARLVANLMWETDFAPFVAQARRVPVEHCRAPAAGRDAPLLAPPYAKSACLAEVGRRIMALPGFAALDAKAYAAMRDTTVFKIKVFDLRGITVYSSEHGQIGEDGGANPGRQSAARGVPASELTHRDRFSAFERVVENRDLISTYVPLHEKGRKSVIGVFEIYSDVTPFLEQIRAASRTFSNITTANEARVAQTAKSNEDELHSSSTRFLSIVGGLLALLYAASLLIVHIGQRIIDRQTLAQERAAQREQLWHREKMTALAAMAANVSHEVGNPLAVISGLADELAAGEAHGRTVAGAPALMREQTARIARMTRQIADFATARSEAPEWVDVNAIVKSVCDFLAFDRRFRGMPIEFRAGQGLPARVLVPDHLNEVMMNLLQACAESTSQPRPCERIQVETTQHGEELVIRVQCQAEPAAHAQAASPVFVAERLEAVHRRAAAMDARLTVLPMAVEVALPAPPETQV